MKHLRQAGFTAIEAIIIGVIVLALVGIGYWIVTKQSDKNKDETSRLEEGESLEAPALPELNTADDLETVENALNEVNLEAGNSDNAELDTQSSGF